MRPCQEVAEMARLTGDDGAHRTELEKAYKLFTDMGATNRAEQLAAKIA